MSTNLDSPHIKKIIPNDKWQRIINENLELSIIIEIWDDILNRMESICFDKYMEKQVKNFVIHCSYLAWCDIINLYFLKRDLGEAADLQESPIWKPDSEPISSIVDPWSEQTIPIMDNIVENEIPQAPSLQKISVIPSSSTIISQLEEGSEVFSFKTYDSSFSSESLYSISGSITKTTSTTMSFYSEPATSNWVMQRKLEMENIKRQFDLTTECIMNWKKKRYIPGEVVPLQVLSASKLPARWVDIKCTVIPAPPYQNTKKKLSTRRPFMITLK